MSTARLQTNNVRVLLVSPQPPPWGGIARWTCLLLEWLSGRDDVDCKTIDIRPFFRRGYDKRLAVRIGAGFLQGPWDLARISMNLAFFKPAVMHLTSSGGLAGVRDLLALWLARLFRVPAVYHIHVGNLPEKMRARDFGARLVARAIRKAEITLVLDIETEQALLRFIGNQQMIRFPNAINMEAWDQEPIANRAASDGRAAFQKMAPHRVLYLGWIIPTKGLRELLAAWRNVAEPDWELILLGPGPDSFKRELRGMDGRQLRASILDEVPHSEARSWLKSADIVVLPSYTEGFPNVILEAMAASKPVVATPVGAIPEILDSAAPEPCGLTVPVGDTVALGRSLARLMGDPPLRKRLGSLARKRVESCYDSDVVFAKLLSIWRSAAGLPNAPEAPDPSRSA